MDTTSTMVVAGPVRSALSFNDKLVLACINSLLEPYEGLLYWQRTPDGYKWVSGMPSGQFKVGSSTTDANYQGRLLFDTHKQADKWFTKMHLATDTQ